MTETGVRRAIGEIARCLWPEPALPVDSAEEAPAAGGAYALAISLVAPTEVRFSGRNTCLEPGTYVYAGSAYGPGGIQSRLRRHFRSDKKLHWHVDWLTVSASDLAALAVVAGSECRIARCLSDLPSFAPVLDGFGSSDCKSCATHLLQWLGQAEQGGTG